MKLPKVAKEGKAKIPTDCTQVRNAVTGEIKILPQWLPRVAKGDLKINSKYWYEHREMGEVYGGLFVRGGIFAVVNSSDGTITPISLDDLGGKFYGPIELEGE